MTEKQGNGGVKFSSTLMGIIGVLAGVVIAVGVPAMILGLSGSLQLTSGATAAVIIVALVMGTGVATVSAFFGIVIPSKVGGHTSRPWEQKKKK